MKQFLRPSLLWLSFAAAPAVPAADYFWDANGAAANTGGTGTWGTANTWRDGSATGALTSWVDGNAAVFGGTAGITTVAAPVSVTELRFSVSGQNIIGAGPVNFGTGGAINWVGNVSAMEITAPLAGAVTLSPVAGTLGSATSAFLKADSPGLTSVTLSGNDPNRNVILDHSGAFGPAGIPVTVTSAVLGLGALTNESLGLANNAANGTGGGMVFPEWNLTLNGAIRSRAGSNTITAPTTLTGASSLLTRGASGVRLTFSPTATINLAEHTLTLHPATSSDGIVLNGAISGTGGITQGVVTLASQATPTSTSTLAGASTYTGPTAINSGHLRLTGSLTSDVTLASGSNLSGEGSTTGSLTFAGTHTLLFDPSTTAALSAGSVNASAATVTLSLSGIGAPVTGLTIIDAPGGITGTVGANFLFTGRGSAYLNNDSTKLLFDYTPATLKWTGADAGNPAFWDTNVTTNWVNGAAQDKFLSADSVVFDETATSFTVTAQGTDVQPGAVLISGPANYTIGGAPITGVAALTKTGASTATLTADNTFSGGTTISGGTLQLGDGSSASGRVGAGNIVNDAALVLNHGGDIVFPNNVTGTGTVTHTGTGVVSITGDIASTGSVTISSATLRLGNNTFSGTISGNIVNNGTLSFYRQDATTVSSNISGTGGIFKSQGAMVTLAGSNTFSGPVDISGNGVTLAAGSPTALGDSTGFTSVAAGSRLLLPDGITITGETILIAGGASNFNGALQAAAGATATWAGPIQLNSADARIGAEPGGTLIVSGAVQDGGGSTINIGAGNFGTGAVVISAPSGVNTYTGNTNVVRGTLRLGAENTLPTLTVLDVDFSTATEVAVLDLNGFSQTAAGLQRTGTGGTGQGVLTNSSATAATLTLNQAIFTTYSGEISGNLALVKDGSGSLDLTGQTLHTGSTRVKAGSLSYTSRTLSDSAAVTIDNGAVLGLNFTGRDRVGSLTINGITLPDGFYSGTSHGGIYAAYLGGTGELQVGASAYDQWIAAYPSLSGDATLPGSDPDGDGVANVLEFALARDPATAEAAPVTPAVPGSDLTLAFKRADAAEGDTVLKVQFSEDLASWPAGSDVVIGAASDTTGSLPGGVVYIVTENGAAPDDILLTLPRGAAVKSFARIAATR